MAYHPMSNDTGGTADDRRAEADRILIMLEPVAYMLTDKETEFVDRSSLGGSVSPKQLFWLRDIKDKYL